MGVKTCPSCGGNGWDYSPSDAKEPCTECKGSGAVASDDPKDEWKEAVFVNGRTEVRDIDMTK